MNWCRTALGALGIAVCYVTPLWAQDAAKPDAPSGTGLLTLLMLFFPAVVIIFFLIPTMRRAKRNTSQIERSLEISEESLMLARERVTLQKETNRLLGQLIEGGRRF